MLNNALKAHSLIRNDEILDIMRNVWSPEFKKFMKLLNENRDDEEKLKAVLKAHPLLYMADVDVKSKAKESELANKKLLETMAELKEGMQDTLKDEENNRKKFEQLFELQKKQIEEVKNVVVRESDRTREELMKTIKGPVDKIIDKVDCIVCNTPYSHLANIWAFAVGHLCNMARRSSYFLF